MTAYIIDEYLKLGKTIALECLEYYYSSILSILGTSSYVIVLSLILNVCYSRQKSVDVLIC
jgi:hypothetical protein